MSKDYCLYDASATLFILVKKKREKYDDSYCPEYGIDFFVSYPPEKAVPFDELHAETILAKDRLSNRLPWRHMEALRALMQGAEDDPAGKVNSLISLHRDRPYPIPFHTSHNRLY